MVFIVKVIVVTTDSGPGQNVKTKWAVLAQPEWQEAIYRNPLL
jgi:ABC-type Fe3+ transport system substrate-binding protein